MSGSTLEAQVVIAGAGPAGIATALRLAQNGVSDVLPLDAQDYPRDKTCGSGLSPRCLEVLRELKIWDRVAAHAYPIHGMVLTTPNGDQVDLPSGDVEVAICLRRVLDHAMLQAAIDLGVRFVPRFKVGDVIVEGGRAVGVHGDQDRQARGRYVVVATGAHSRQNVDPAPAHAISTIMGWWEGVPFKPNYLEMMFDPAIAPYYGWLFPEGPNRVNIGITYWDPGVKHNAKTLFEGFLDRQLGDRLRNATRLGGYRGHPIKFNYRLPRLTAPGRVVVGEAGRMTHPATGEGISQGMRSGVFAADALTAILQRGRNERLAFAAYEARCTAAFVPSFLAGGAFLKAVDAGVLDVAARWSRNPKLNVVTRTLLANL